MDLTRRALIARGAAAAGALMGGSLLAPRLVFAGESGEAVVALRMPRSQRIETKRTFELVAVEASGAEVRALGVDGRWSEWLPLHPGHEGAPRGLSDPVWTGPARAFEFRSSHSLHGARVLLVDSGRPAASAAATRYVTTDLEAGSGQPQIIARSSWATSACRPRVPAVFGAVDLAFVHHTVSSNSYRSSQSAAMVRSICLFHKYGNGWNDIGYNFVVDRYGQIFEARAGGIDETIVGAQAGGFNVYSTGVAMLGNFTYGGPPRRAFDSLSKLLAWKLSLHGVELPGQVTVNVTRQGAPYSRYRAGAAVDLNRISGHRDADSTSCPGGGMYRQLPRLRRVVQNLAGTVTDLSIGLDPPTPGNATLSGVLTVADAGIVGAPVEIQTRSVTRGPRTVATATTNEDGTWSAAVPLTSNAALRAVFRGDGVNGAAVSPGLFATVPPQITLNASALQGPPGTVIEFSGQITPVKDKGTLVVSQKQPDGSDLILRSIRFDADDDGSYSRLVGFPDAGQFQVIVHTAPDDKNALGTAPPLTITIG